MKLAFIIALLFALGSCLHSTDSGQNPEDLPLAYKQPVYVSALNLTLTLDNVADGRCPKDALCIVASHAEIQILAKQGIANQTIFLGIGGFRYSKSEILFDKYRVEFLSLEPDVDASRYLKNYKAHVNISALPSS